MTAMKTDLDCAEHIRIFIHAFYDKVLADEILAHIFHDVAGIDVNQHIPIIITYWQKLLLGEKGYSRHTMNIHREVHRKFPFTDKEFERWVHLFVLTAETEFAGPFTQKAIKIATMIASNMQESLHKYPDANPDGGTEAANYSVDQ